ncbi:hypothetical protein ACWEOA_23880 [Streptomyces sp. NPDC004457]
MQHQRLIITGASGTGTTTLGRALASLMAVPHADVDDYLWLPTSPPYTHKRSVAERIRLMEALFVPRDSWVLSGSLRGWGDGIADQADAVVFLSLDADARMDRLRRREIVRYGDTIAPGGDNEAAHQAFLRWAQQYDDSALVDRRRDRDERWLAGLSCPVLTLRSSEPVTRLVDRVTDWLDGPDAPRGRRS